MYLSVASSIILQENLVSFFMNEITCCPCVEQKEKLNLQDGADSTPFTPLKWYDDDGIFVP